MTALIVGILLLFIAPAIAGLVVRSRVAWGFVDGFILVSIGGLCLFHVLPEALPALGYGALLAIAGGLLLPMWAERKLHDLENTHKVVLVLALLALLLHAALDGVGLSVGRSSLSAPIVLHRVPVGLFVWWNVGRGLSRRAAWLVLFGLAAATVAGYGLGHWHAEWVESAALTWIQCLLVGSLMHILLHQPLHKGPGRVRTARAAAVGALVAAAGMLLFREEGGHGHVHDHALEHGIDLWHPFFALFTESAGPILIGFLGAGLLLKLSARTVSRAMQGRNAASSALRGVVYGLPLPICSCGVVPLYRSLISRGAPAAAALAFLIATPELGLDAVLLSFPLLGVPLTVARLIAAFAIAFLVGTFLGRKIPPAPVSEETEEEPAYPGFLGVLRYAFGDMIDHLGPWILLGLLAAVYIEPLLDPDFLAAMPDSLEVLVTVLLSTPAYVCASAATPIAAVMILSGLSPGAALAFLLAGPATNLTTFGMLRQSHGLRPALWVVAAVVGLSIGAGLVTNLVLGDLPPVALDLHEHEPSTWELIAAWIFGGLLLLSLVRNGPRRMLAQLGLAPHSHDHDHADDDHHDKDGEAACPAPEADACCG